ncbi:MAG: phospholipase D family protein [Gammaproteobacteria bacterium]|jgi:putative cardiolipin synthase|nr:phospholipase D family protein [Gammaproteobacteria bacterium]
MKVSFVGLLSLSLLGACASLPQNIDRQSSVAFTDTANTVLGDATKDDLAQHPGLSGFHLLPSGLDAFAARAVLAYSAERSIDAQYYLLHSDLVGRLFVDALLRAADRGVRVRLLLDDMTLDDDKDIGAAALDAHDNIEVRVFNPFARQSSRWMQILSRFDEVTRRMHNKSFTVDNQISVLGGRNIGNEYFEADPNLAFGDLDVLAVGPVVNEVSTSFDLYWNSSASYPATSLITSQDSIDDLDQRRKVLSEFVEQQRDSEYLQALRSSDLVTRLKNDAFVFDWGAAQVLYDDPAKITSSRDQTDLHLATQLEPFSAQITRELTIFSPYFVPGREGVANIEKLRARGVRVRILTNSLASTDVSAVHAGYSKYRKYLLRAGVELYELDQTLSKEQRKDKKGAEGSSKASLHAKSFAIDRERIFIGSLNFDPRSVVENTEIGVMIESASIATEMSDWFDQKIDQVAFRLALEEDDNGNEILVWHRSLDGVEQRYTTEPNTGFWRRFGVGFLRLLPIESLL